jgi:hypothetical protein
MSFVRTDNGAVSAGILALDLGFLRGLRFGEALRALRVVDAWGESCRYSGSIGRLHLVRRTASLCCDIGVGGDEGGMECGNCKNSASQSKILPASGDGIPYGMLRIYHRMSTDIVKILGLIVIYLIAD